MSDEQKFEVAKQYVDKQLEAMRSFGAAPNNMSNEEYKALVEEVADTIQK